MSKTATFLYIALVFFFVAEASSAAEQRGRNCNIFLNGEITEVYFNDGDTFKVLHGELKGARSRIAGFNTLESYGPVHQWKEATVNYLFGIANAATEHARNGGWHCQVSDKKDIYGRILASCDDLAVSLIEKGLAHTFTMDSKPGKSEYLAAQHRSQENKLGMWKHGVPEYIITSLHSIDESRNKENDQKRRAYNRLISSNDGHTQKWTHRDVYGTCENVCIENENSCMVYVPFRIRYGNNKPGCLKVST